MFNALVFAHGHSPFNGRDWLQQQCVVLFLSHTLYISSCLIIWKKSESSMEQWPFWFSFDFPWACDLKQWINIVTGWLTCLLLMYTDADAQVCSERSQKCYCLIWPGVTAGREIYDKRVKEDLFPFQFAGWLILYYLYDGNRGQNSICLLKYE